MYMQLETLARHTIGTPRKRAKLSGAIKGQFPSCRSKFLFGAATDNSGNCNLLIRFMAKTETPHVGGIPNFAKEKIKALMSIGVARRHALSSMVCGTRYTERCPNLRVEEVYALRNVG